MPSQSIDNELEHQVFLAVYRSRNQRYRRSVANSLLVVKHSLRGLLFSWPLYLLPLSALALPVGLRWLSLPLLLPAVWISVKILQTGIREDYRRLVHGRLLKDGYPKKILFPGHPVYD